MATCVLLETIPGFHVCVETELGFHGLGGNLSRVSYLGILILEGSLFSLGKGIGVSSYFVGWYFGKGTHLEVRHSKVVFMLIGFDFW